MTSLSFFKASFPLVESFGVYIARTSNKPWSGFNDLHVATLPLVLKRQAIPPLANNIDMLMILDAMDTHIKQHRLDQKVPRYLVQEHKSEWESLLATIGATDVLDLLLNTCVFIEQAKGSFQQVSGPSINTAIATPTASLGKRRASDDFEAVVTKTPNTTVMLTMPLTSFRWLYGKPPRGTDKQLLYTFRTRGLFDDAGIPEAIPTDSLTIRLLKGVAPHEFGADKELLPSGIPKRLALLGPILSSIVSNHPRQSLYSTLDATCPKKNSALINSHQVALFVKATVKMAIPLELFGSKDNWDVFSAFLLKYLSLKKNDSIRIHDGLANNFKMDDCSWLALPDQQGADLSKMEWEIRRELMEYVLHWLFDKYISCIIRSFFYATELQGHGNRLFYYRHDDWAQMSDTFYADTLAERFEEVNKDFVKGLQLGSSSIRLIPKDTGFRAIYQMKKATTLVESADGSTSLSTVNNNKKLQSVKSVMDLEVSRQVDIMEDGSRSIHLAVEQLAKYKEQVCVAAGSASSLYFCKVDFQKCFDTIDQQKLLRFLDNVFLEDEYAIRKYQSIEQVGDKMMNVFRKVATSPTSAFHDIIESHRKHISKSVTVSSKAQPEFCPLKSLLSILKEHVENNTVYHEGKFYRQKTGIPQGSAVSPLLCNLYFDQLELEFLSQFRYCNDGVMVRYMDDYLFISRSKKRVREFHTVMTNGFKEYGCHINLAKTETNLDSLVSEFAWCGLKISTATLDIYNDYSSCSMSSIRSSIAVNVYSEGGKRIGDRCLSTIKRQLNWHHLAKNSDDASYRNMYQATVLSGKILSFCFFQMSKDFGGPINEDSAIAIVSDAVDWVLSLVKRTLDRQLVTALMGFAFASTLKKRKQLFGKVLNHIDDLIRSTSRRHKACTMINKWPQSLV